jgi:transposase
MISTIVQLLISFPKIGSLLLKIRDEYVKEVITKRYNKHSDIIDDWVQKYREK